MKRQTSLRGLRTFCEAAKHQSFRDAAENMFVTASAVSHQIKNLEDELGQQLFERTARNIRLTDAGQSLYENVHPLIEKLDIAVSDHAQTKRRSRLSVSVQPFFASELFVPKLPDFLAANPDIDLRVDTSDEASEKFVPSTDVSIRLFRSPPGKLVSDKLFPLQLMPAGSPDFKANLNVSRKAVRSRFPLIVHDGRPKAWKQWAEVSGVNLPAETTLVHLASMIAVMRAAERGIGAALVPVELSKAWFDNGNIVPLFRKPLVTDEAYYFVCSEEASKRPTVQRLREWVLQNFASAA